MHDLTTEKTMTVKEIADILGLDKRTIQLKVKELFPNKVLNGITTFLNEKEVTVLKINLEKKFEVNTELEMLLLQKKLDKWKDDKIALLSKENEIMKPKSIAFDTYMNSKDLMPMRVAATELKYGRNKLFQLLRENMIIDKYNIPYQQYIDNKFFEVKKINLNNGEVHNQAFVTNKGLELCRKLIERL